MICWQCYNYSFLAYPQMVNKVCDLFGFSRYEGHLHVNSAPSQFLAVSAADRRPLQHHRGNLQTTKLLHEVLGPSCKYNNTTQCWNIVLLTAVCVCVRACVWTSCVHSIFDVVVICFEPKCDSALFHYTCASCICTAERLSK